jgi:hypothetical protein
MPFVRFILQMLAQWSIVSDKGVSNTTMMLSRKSYISEEKIVFD